MQSLPAPDDSVIISIYLDTALITHFLFLLLSVFFESSVLTNFGTHFGRENVPIRLA